MRNLKHKTEINPADFVTASGSRKKKVYSPRFDGKKLTLVQTGEVDIQDEINAHAPECDMNFILSRLANGDMSALTKKNPLYADFHNLPENFRDMIDIALNSEHHFNALPLEVRKQFDNDYRQWIYRAGTDDWMKIMYPDLDHTFGSEVSE